MCLLALPTAAMASNIEFGANDPGTGQPVGVHLHSQGRVNFDWVPVNAPASLASEFWGANDIKVFEAIGLSSVQAGQTYSVLNNYGVSMWFDASGLPNILSGDQTATGYTSWDFFATMQLTSISFSADGNTMSIGGYLTNMLNNLTGSAVLSDLAASNSPSFILAISANSRTTDMITALNSSALSSWADLGGSVGMSITATPEPGSMVLFGSAAGLMGWLRRRRQGRRQQAQA
ncbi:MAG: PEP-CTERM sorting domain-containing protein [Pseudomonadota bacterium]